MTEREWIEGDWKFGSSGGDETYLKVHLKFRSVVPDLSIPEPTDVSYDFSAALAEFLGLSQDAWRIEGLGISRSVPQRVLHEFYDGALLYGAMLAGKLPDAFGALCAERLLVKCLSGFPEVLVKYRYYRGLANDDGEYRILSDRKDDLALIGIQDPYDRLYWLPAPSTARKIRERYGKVSIVVRGGRDLPVYKKGAPLPVLGFQWCLRQLFGERDDPVRDFLRSVYENVRVPEYHGCRLGDNAVFQVHRLVPGLVRAMNYLFTEDLEMPWKRQPRKPFALRLFRMAGAEPIPGSKMLVHLQDCLLPVESASRHY